MDCSVLECFVFIRRRGGSRCEGGRWFGAAGGPCRCCCWRSFCCGEAEEEEVEVEVEVEARGGGEV
jgi:hypothetical protein